MYYQNVEKVSHFELFTVPFCDWLLPEMELGDWLFPELSLVAFCTITFTPGDWLSASLCSALMGVANGALGREVLVVVVAVAAPSPFFGLLK